MDKNSHDRKREKWSLLDSGQKLWRLGYDDLNFLSYGSQGVIWEDINRKKAVKVVAKEEKSDISKIKNILNDNKKYKKYFADIEDVSFKNIDNMPNAVYEMPLANCDFYDVTKRKADARKNNNENKKKHIDNLLSSAKSLMKAIMVLHDLGYFHNDIKPDNLLQMQKSFSELEAKVKKTNGKIVLGSEKLRFYKKNKYNKLEKIHQHRLVLSDFDTMTKIQDELDGKLKIDDIKGWLFQLIPGKVEENTGDSDKIKKRDVWAAGVSLFVMLMGEKISNYCTTNALKNKIRMSSNGLYSNCGDIYDPEDKKKIINFLEIIKSMVQSEPSKRCTAEEAYNKIKKLIGPESTK